MKNLLEVIESLPTPMRERVLEAARPADLTEIRLASTLAWVDVGVLLGLDDAVASQSDVALVDQVFRGVARVDFGSAYLRPFVTGAVTLFGASPGDFVKWIPRAWGTVFRDAGIVEAKDVTLHEARLVHTQLAPALVNSVSWLPGHRAYFDGIFDVAKTPGTVAVEEWTPAARKLVLRFSW